MTLATYVAGLEALSSGACARARDTVYLFGGNYR